MYIVFKYIKFMYLLAVLLIKIHQRLCNPFLIFNVVKLFIVLIIIYNLFLCFHLFIFYFSLFKINASFHF